VLVVLLPLLSCPGADLGGVNSTFGRALLGPNGAGKTTTMRVILGLDAPGPVAFSDR
jgi:ABC-type branched-subunit amino acid transport system ATPase component